MSDSIKNNDRRIILKNRNRISIEGVIEVIGFDETCVSIVTDLGLLFVEGSSMRIESLGKDDGIIHINGDIEGLYYREEKGKKKHFKLFG